MTAEKGKAKPVRLTVDLDRLLASVGAILGVINLLALLILLVVL